MTTPYERLTAELDRYDRVCEIYGPDCPLRIMCVMSMDLRTVLAEHAAYRAALELIGNYSCSPAAMNLANKALEPPTGA